MDKILTKKILGLKIGDILKCVILVVIGYCIAVMLGNCNCVEGWCDNKSCNCADLDTDCQGPNDDGYTYPCPDSGYCLDLRERCGENTDCAPAARTRLASQQGIDEAKAVNEYECVQGHWCRRYTDGSPAGTCVKPPGGAVGGFDGDGGGGSYGGWCVAPPPPAPTPAPPPIPQTIVCENGSCNQYPTSVAKSKTGSKTDCRTLFGRIDCDVAKADCEKNCNTPPPPPPTPPTPSVCAYYGDGLTRRKRDSKELDSKFWRSRSAHKQGEEVKECRDSIGICRNAWQKWADDNNKPYTGFCIQTLKDGKYEGAADVRGDCPLTPAPGGSIPDTWITYNNGKTPEQNCTSKDAVGPEGGKGNAGDFAWVSEKLDKTCKCEEDSGNTNIFTRSTTFRPGDAMTYVEDIEKKFGFAA
jgi:hypothetical protein